MKHTLIILIVLLLSACGGEETSQCVNPEGMFRTCHNEDCTARSFVEYYQEQCRPYWPEKVFSVQLGNASQDYDCHEPIEIDYRISDSGHTYLFQGLLKPTEQSNRIQLIEMAVKLYFFGKEKKYADCVYKLRGDAFTH